MLRDRRLDVKGQPWETLPKAMRPALGLLRRRARRRLRVRPRRFPLFPLSFRFSATARGRDTLQALLDLTNQSQDNGARKCRFSRLAALRQD
jgi:hypothetical protein